MKTRHTVSYLVIAALTAGCNDWDNPVALSELQVGSYREGWG